MMNCRQYIFTIRMLFSDLSSLFDGYLKSFEELELRNYRPNEESGKFHCVYERRLHEVGYIDGSGSTITIDNILDPDEDHIQDRQMLCISAMPGYGKEFFAKRICMMNYDIKYAKKQEYDIPFDPFSDKGRLPFIIKRTDIEKYHEMKLQTTFNSYNEFCLLCVISMNRVWRRKQGNQEEYSLLSEDFLVGRLAKKMLHTLQNFLAKGCLFVLFEKDTIEYIEEIENIVNTCIPESKAMEGVQKNLLVFIFDNERQNPFEDGFYNMTLSALSSEEVMDHIRFCSGGNGEVIEEFRNLFGKLPALTVPDCLLFITETHISKVVNMGSIKMAETAAELYEDCIRAAIQDRVECSRQEDSFELLRGHAWSVYRHGEPRMSISEREKFQFCEGKTNHLLNWDGQFRFDGCKEYLIASNLYNRLSGVPAPEQVQELLHGANDNIIKRLIEISAQQYKKRNERDYSGSVTEKIWAYLVSDIKDMTSGNAELLLYFMEYIEDRGDTDQIDYLEVFVKQIVTWLSGQEYDSRIFDFISASQKKLRPMKIYINKELKKIYISNIEGRRESQNWAYNADKMRFNRRFLFYVGIHSEVTKEIIEGITDVILSSHEKYHLMRALLDNTIRNQKMDEIRNKLDIIEKCNDVQQDVILKSDVMVLRWRLYDETISSDKESKMIEALQEKLQDNVYWIRAHAADALGHLTQLRIPHILCDNLCKELDREEDDYTKLKVVNYFVEAVCEFFYFHRLAHPEPSSNERDIIGDTAQNMLRTIQGLKSDQMDRQKMNMSVCITISEGVLYIISERYTNRPELMRIRVDNELGRWHDITRQIIKALEGREESSSSDMLVNMAKQISDTISDMKEAITHVEKVSVNTPELIADEEKERENTKINIFIKTVTNSQFIGDKGIGIQHNISKKGDNNDCI